VLALYNKYLGDGDKFVPKYMDLLSSGGSDSPYSLLDRVGVDIKDPNFWNSGLEILRGMLNEAIIISDHTK